MKPGDILKCNDFLQYEFICEIVTERVIVVDNKNLEDGQYSYNPEMYDIILLTNIFRE